MGDLETDNATNLSNSQDNQPNNVAVEQPPNPAPGAAAAAKQVLQIPSDRVKQIKDKARNKGKNEYKRQLDTQARELGFKDHEDLMAHAKNNRQQQGNRQNVANQPNTARTERNGGNNRSGGELRVVTNQDGEQSVRQLQRQVQRLTQENERLRNAKQKESHARGRAETRVKELEGQMAAVEARTELQMKAMQAGIRDPRHIRFALAELQDALQGKTDAELTAFDELGFLKGLQGEHPYLFGVQEAPASSTPSKEPKEGEQAQPKDGAPPAPPGSARDAAPPPKDPEKFDAMEGDLDDANSRLAKSGMSFQFQRRLPQEQMRQNRPQPPNR